jgi:phosphotransacetylase
MIVVALETFAGSELVDPAHVEIEVRFGVEPKIALLSHSTSAALRRHRR